MTRIRGRLQRIERRLGKVGKIGPGQLLPVLPLVSYLSDLSESDLARVADGQEPKDAPGVREWLEECGFVFDD